MIITNILDANGTVIGTMSLPDGTSTEEVNAQLALYAAPPVPALIISTARYPIAFSYQGTPIVGTYLQIAGIPTSVNPFVTPEPAIIRSWSISSNVAGTSTYDVQVNGVMVFQVTMANDSVDIQSGLSYPLAAGDQVSILCTSGDTSTGVASPVINLFIQNTGG